MSETIRAYLKVQGKYLGVDPNYPDGDGDDAYPVYANRVTPRGWEGVEIDKLDNGGYSVRFQDANRLLCLRPDGRLQSRPAGAPGPWETLAGAEQPDGLKLLYRVQDDVLVSTVIQVEVIT